ncbi:hypothetical protein BOX15_Mlig030237g1, partial [Macrostomum lignano]
SKANIMSSWQPWVDNMMQYPGVNAAAIFGLDGSVWAQSGQCSPSQAEVQALVAGTGKSSAGEFSAFSFQGRRFMTLRLQDGEIDARSGPSSLSAMRTGQAVIVGGYLAEEGEQASMAGCQRVNFAASKIKEALTNSGY